MTCPSVWRLSHPVRPGSNLKLNSKLFSRHGGFNWRDRKAEVFLPPIMFLPPIPNFHIRPQSFNIKCLIFSDYILDVGPQERRLPKVLFTKKSANLEPTSLESVHCHEMVDFRKS